MAFSRSLCEWCNKEFSGVCNDTLLLVSDAQLIYMTQSVLTLFALSPYRSEAQ